MKDCVCMHPGHVEYLGLGEPETAEIPINYHYERHHCAGGYTCDGFKKELIRPKIFLLTGFHPGRLFKVIHGISERIQVCPFCGRNTAEWHEEHDVNEYPQAFIDLYERPSNVMKGIEGYL